MKTDQNRTKIEPSPGTSELKKLAWTDPQLETIGTEFDIANGGADANDTAILLSNTGS